jgi:hypothetical protein
LTLVFPRLRVARSVAQMRADDARALEHRRASTGLP